VLTVSAADAAVTISALLDLPNRLIAENGRI
jgi:hypothetical protein